MVIYIASNQLPHPVLLLKAHKSTRILCAFFFKWAYYYYHVFFYVYACE